MKPFVAAALVGVTVLAGTAGAQVKTAYPQMAPMDQYMMPESAEVALARTAAPTSISAKAKVLVLRKDG